MTLITIIIGTASSNPQIPQAQLQNSRPANTATWFIDAARPISVGVRSNPSSVVISNDTPATAIVIPMVPNCRKPTIASPPAINWLAAGATPIDVDHSNVLA